MDLNNIRSLSILDSHVEGFILSMPHYLNRKLEINIINNTFYVCNIKYLKPLN